jgi:rare lipoprotein A
MRMNVGTHRSLNLAALALVAGLGAAGLSALPAAANPGAAQSGGASWYGHGSRTASGERFNPGGMTAAHRSLPFGTRVKVVHKGTGRSVVVRINDRGPFTRGRIIDLSRGSARALGMGGVAQVALYRLD